MWVDAHCHLDFSVFDEDREQVIKEAYQLGVTKVAVPGIYPNQWHQRDEKLSRLAKRLHQKGLLEWQTVFQYGVHPYWVDHWDDEAFSVLASMLEGHSSALVGEIGLDFTEGQAPIEIQLKCFEQQLQLAGFYQRPIVLHVRKAHHEIQRILKQQAFSFGGLVHAFTGSVSLAEYYQDLGFKLGVGGAMTHTRATKLRETLKFVPLESLLLETDAPDMVPAFLLPKQVLLGDSQGNKIRNTPSSIPKIAQALAELKAIALEEIHWVQCQQAIKLFNFRQ